MEGGQDEDRGEDEQDAVAAGSKHGGPSHPSEGKKEGMVVSGRGSVLGLGEGGGRERRKRKR